MFLESQKDNDDYWIFSFLNILVSNIVFIIFNRQYSRCCKIPIHIYISLFYKLISNDILTYAYTNPTKQRHIMFGQ